MIDETNEEQISDHDSGSAEDPNVKAPPRRSTEMTTPKKGSSRRNRKLRNRQMTEDWED